MASAGQPEWPYRPGDSPLRREVHDLVGGNRQYGIVTLTNAPDILLFSNRKNGSIYGYDVHEGAQEDGSFAYTGEGQRGDQTFTRGNLAIRDSAANGRPIRLFTVEGTRATYVGEYTTGEPTYGPQTFPDIDGNPRTGIIFKLVPVDARPDLLVDRRAPVPPAVRVMEWTPPDSSDVVIEEPEAPVPGDRRVSRIEFQLQVNFGNWLRERGETVRRLQLYSDGTLIEPDLYVESLGWIVEAKKSTARVRANGDRASTRLRARRTEGGDRGGASGAAAEATVGGSGRAAERLESQAASPQWRDFRLGSSRRRGGAVDSTSTILVGLGLRRSAWALSG